MENIIEIKNLSKKYNISHQRGGYIALRDVLTNIIKNPFRFAKAKVRQIARLETKEEFWALKDINLAIKKGEVIGIIGHNGAGKSTLLKILSQITPPTTGEIKIKGTVGSLLEVGTGFHPELTGRENILLNGAILGMTRKEIAKKFNAIVEFSGVEKFLDTPVKYYSSGMYVRLAFSVAAHLEPDILFIDEVLAVGDAEFQKKCLGKMEDVTKNEGRTILFVSHNMDAVLNLCQRCVLLEKGKIKNLGNTKKIIDQYLGSDKANKIINWSGNAGDANVRLLRSWAKSLDQQKEFDTSSAIEVGLEIEILRPTSDLILGFTLFSEFNYELAYVLYDDKETTAPPILPPGKMIKKFIIPKDTLTQGTYRIQFDIGINAVKRIIKYDGELIFTLNNLYGLGGRFKIPSSSKGYTSLFRPPWAVI